MSRARRKQFNTIEAASLARWIVLTIFIGLTGLSYVYLTVQLHHLGESKRKLENELVALRTQTEVERAQVTALTSRSALQRRLKEGYLKMISVSEQNIVRLSTPTRTPGEDSLQPVVNRAK
jgi:hypothetical protein